MNFETVRWLKKRNGTPDTEKKECDAKTVERQNGETAKQKTKTARTDGTAILSDAHVEGVRLTPASPPEAPLGARPVACQDLILILFLLFLLLLFTILLIVLTSILILTLIDSYQYEYQYVLP